MENPNSLIAELKAAHEELDALVHQFPEEKRGEILFGEWSLKSVLAHIVFWDLYTLREFRKFRVGRRAYWSGTVDGYNKRAVERSKNKKWEQVYVRFKRFGEELLEEYIDLPEELWEAKFWKRQKHTPLSYLITDIGHYREEHLPQIREVLSNL